MLQKLGKVLALFSPEQPELSVREIARVFRWPKSTAYRILSRIEASGFLDRDEHSGAYRLGIRLAAYGELARHSTSLQRVVSPWLRKLSDATSETATLMLFNGTEGVTVDVVESFQPLMLPGHEEVDTLGGLVFALAGRVPARGEAIKHPAGLDFDVLDADPRRVKRLRVRGLPAAEGAP